MRSSLPAVGAPFAVLVVAVLGCAATAQTGGVDAGPHDWSGLREQLAAIAGDAALSDADRVGLTLRLVRSSHEAGEADAPGDGGYMASEEFFLACVDLLAQGCRPESLAASLREPGPPPVDHWVRPLLLFAWAAACGREALGGTTEPDLSDEIRKLLASSADAFLRAMAADALGALRDRSAYEVLAAALADGSYRTGPRVSDDPASGRIYIVRRAAAMALLRLGHEVERPAFDTWVVDPPLITGVAGEAFLARLGGEWRPTRVSALGREWVLASDPSTLVSLAVLASYWEARGTVLAAVRAVPAAPAPPLDDLGDVAFRWGDCTVLVAVRNAVIGVCAATREGAVELARAAAEALGEAGQCATLGRPVVMPEVALECAPTGRPGDQLLAKWRTDTGAGVLFGVGAQGPRRDGVVPLDLHETARGEAATDLFFATEDCVMVRKTVIIKVVPWEDEGPTAEE